MRISHAYRVVPVVAILATVPGFASSREQFLLDEGKELYQAQQYEQAIARFDDLLELDPTNWSANYLTAVSYLALYHPGSQEPKDLEYAAKGSAAFERTLELAPPSAEEREKAEKYYVGLLGSTGETDKAIAYLERQLATHPNDAAYIAQIAAQYQRKGDFATALEYFERRATSDPKNKEAWYTLGVNCWARSYHGGSTLAQAERETIVDLGIQAFEKALAIDPDYFDALAYINLIYREKAKALENVGRGAEAQDAYAKADDYMQRAIEIRKRQTARVDGS